ncbi:HTH_Tnp_Tc3_2 domain-containing protein [Trichonephila clavipes]|nr:HTH_Tnp_Tc3_2 domain-containing protein [Trichonephila clavipes]
MDDSERWRAVGHIEVGQSITDVALFFGVHHSVISRLWKQFQTTQTVIRRPIGSRPRVITPAKDRYIAIVAKRNSMVTSICVTSMVTASIGKSISAATVHRRLHMNGLYARAPRVWIPLSVQSRGTRLNWCREHGNWTVSDWRIVMFTNESRFALEPDDKRIRIWRKQGTCNQPQNITEHHAFQGGSIMQGNSPLLRISAYPVRIYGLGEKLPSPSAGPGEVNIAIESCMIAIRDKDLIILKYDQVMRNSPIPREGV